MLTGRHAFDGDTITNVLGAILGREPDWTALPGNTPVSVRRLLTHCLEKDPEHRANDISRIRAELDGAGRATRRLVIAAVLMMLVVIVVGTLVTTRGARGHTVEPAEYQQLTNFSDSVTQPALASDDRMLTFLRGANSFMGKAEVYVKMLPDGEPIQLTHDAKWKIGPVFSPEGSHVAYSAQGEQERWDSWIVPVAGGAPQLLLTNSSALNWVDPHRVIFSELKAGGGLTIATSLEQRVQRRDVYVPADRLGMAHRSFVSPDQKWLLVVEMEPTGPWAPCRLAPFDGRSPWRPVGPPGPCTFAAWSPDGTWMYFSASNTGENFHIWRQRFPDGPLERITSGPAEEEGIAVAHDGRSLITAVALRHRPIWFHDRSGDHQVSVEGYAFTPRLGARDRNVYYRISKSTGGVLNYAEVWKFDLASKHNELVLPGFDAVYYDVSDDGRLLVAALDRDNKPRLWLVPPDRHSSPRRISGVESSLGLISASNGVLFLAHEGNRQFLFRIREDGTGLEKINSDPISEIHGVSPDGEWVSGYGPVPGREAAFFEFAYSTRGRPSVRLCNPACRVKWARDGRYMYFSVPSGYASYSAIGRTYVVPTRNGSMFPDLPPDGLRSEAEFAAIPGVRVLDAADVDPGPSPDEYVFSREVVQRNLYRIRLP
jgi:Tol biopolymer transport system component